MSPNYNNFPILLIFRCNNTLNINNGIIVALLNEMEASESKWVIGPPNILTSDKLLEIFRNSTVNFTEK